MEELVLRIQALAESYSASLSSQIERRRESMKSDDTSHYLIYRVLGVTAKEGQRIDEYQNTGRFLYKYAGSFLEEATRACLNYKFPDGIKTKIKNPFGERPQTFEIDFLHEKDAIEIKWRDSTTDGDHVIKEHARVKAIRGEGFKPIRLMFYDPQRKQALRIQETLKTLYAGVGGEFYSGEEAWAYLSAYSGVDLRALLVQIADEKSPEHGE
jgi:hypothetical protein